MKRQLFFVMTIFSLLLVACGSGDIAPEAGAEVEAQASPTVEVATINLSAGEELVLVAGFLGGSQFRGVGYAAEGEEISVPGPTIRVRKGETITIRFENTNYFEDGTPFPEAHNFSVVADKDIPAFEMEPLWGANVGGFGDPYLKPGERGSVTFTADTAGIFFYVCSLSEHISNGMSGLFIVYE